MTTGLPDFLCITSERHFHSNIYTLGSKYFSRDLGEILPQST